jgi:cell volume regulation protein A
MRTQACPGRAGRSRGAGRSAGTPAAGGASTRARRCRADVRQGTLAGRCAATPAIFPVLLLLAAGLVAERLSLALGVPDLVLFLAGGVLLGPVLGAVHLEATGPLAGFVLTFGAAFMLYEGGRRLTLPLLREIWAGLALLSTVGVLVTAAVVTAAARGLGQEAWVRAGLYGAVLASTDPATVIPLLHAVRIRPRLARLLEAESACNDAFSAVLTFALVGLAQHGRLSLAASAAQLVWMVLGGAAVGVAVGALAAWSLPLLDGRRQGALLSLLVILGAYAAADALRASAYMAVFAAGVAEANRLGRVGTHPRGHRRLRDAYLGQVGMLVRMWIFLVLGAVIDLRGVGQVLGPGLALAGILVFVARPLTVLCCLPLDRVARWRWGEILFASWVRETGVVPAALAGLLLQRGVPGAGGLAATTFVAILFTLLLQPATTRWWARRTGVAEGGPEGAPGV